MKKTLSIGIIIAAVIAVTIITQQPRAVKNESASDSLAVATTIFPLYDITKNVGGAFVDVELVLPSGTSPHTFDPQPRVLRDLEGSQVLFAIGNGLDDWSYTLAESLDIPVVTVDDGIALRETADFHEEHNDAHGHDRAHHHHEEDEHEGHNHGPIDPHYWLSIKNAQRITENIARELSQRDPLNESAYQANAQVYINELEALYEENMMLMNDIENGNIIALHDAWYYFAQENDLNLIGTFEPSAGKEPTPRYLQNLKEEIEEFGVKTLFVEPQLSETSISAFAKDNNLSIAVIDPLGGEMQRQNYVDLMRYNAQQVHTALNQ